MTTAVLQECATTSDNKKPHLLMGLPRCILHAACGSDSSNGHR